MLNCARAENEIQRNYSLGYHHVVCIGKTKCTVQVKDVYYKKDSSLF